MHWSTSGLNRYTSFGCGLVASCRSFSRTPWISPISFYLSGLKTELLIYGVDGALVALGQRNNSCRQVFQTWCADGLGCRQVRHWYRCHNNVCVFLSQREILARVLLLQGLESPLVGLALLGDDTFDAAEIANTVHFECSMTTIARPQPPEAPLVMPKLCTPADNPVRLNTCVVGQTV